MTGLEDQVRHEIEEFHRFFVEWFNGTAGHDQLHDRFVSHMHPGFVFLTPDGDEKTRDDLEAAFLQAHGSNVGFRIQIRDVRIRHDLSDHIVATYTEWQIGAKTTACANNARISSVLMTKSQPLQWLMVQETWLPDAMRRADPFDF